MSNLVEVMKNWFCVWARRIRSSEPLDSVDLYEKVAGYWYDRANKEGFGRVIERKCFDDEGFEVAEVYVHKELIFAGKPCHPYASISVFSGGDAATIQAVEAFWRSREQVHAAEGVGKCGANTLRVLEGMVVVERWLAEAYAFESSIHPHNRN